MKKYKKILVALAVSAFLCAVFCTGASAATMSDGLKAEISTGNAGDAVAVDIALTNTNYYQVDHISYTLSASENGVLTGDLSKDALTLKADESVTAQAKLTLKADATSPTPQITEPTKATQAPTTPTTAKPTSVSLTNASSAGKTATGDSFPLWPVLGILIFCVLVIIAAVAVKKRKSKNLLSVLLCIMLVVPIGTTAMIHTDAAADTSYLSFTEQAQVPLNGQQITLTLTVTYPKQDELHDNTLEDIALLNGGQPDVVYNNAGEISFLNGRFTDYKITDENRALTALQAVSTLLHVNEKDISAVCIMTKENNLGDTYYTFQQAAGSTFLSNAYITVGADRDGNALCISSSINPEADVADFTGSLITAQQADAAVSAVFPTLEKVDKEPELDYLAFNSVLCWVVYRLDNSTTDEPEQKPVYIKTYIHAVTGAFVSFQNVTSLEDYRTQSPAYNNDSYFQCDTELMTFTTYQNRQVQLSVAKDNKTGKYYFCDTQRHILPADGHATAKINFISPVLYYFDDPAEVPATYISVIYNITRAYDAYEESGVKSIDGEGLPLVIYLGYEENGKEVENACYMGNLFGWGAFMFSDFPISTGFDVAAHEFTHGIKANWTGQAAYQNATGAIEESYADILGNLTEMLTDPAHADTQTWQLGESTGKVIRSMSNPNLFAQPEYFGDAYYLVNVLKPGSLNDNGGVHINNSILSKIVYDSCQQGGMRMEDAYDLWLSTFLFFNKEADYDDIFAYIKYTAQRLGMEQYIPLLTTLFENANILDADTSLAPDFPPKDGFATVNFTITNLPEDLEWSILFKSDACEETSILCADKNGTTRMVLPKSTVTFKLRDQTNTYSIYSQEENPNAFTITDDGITITVDYNDLLSQQIQPAA